MPHEPVPTSIGPLSEWVGEAGVELDSRPIGLVLLDRAEATPDAPAVHSDQAGQPSTLTYRQLADEAVSLAQGPQR